MFKSSALALLALLAASPSVHSSEDNIRGGQDRHLEQLVDDVYDDGKFEERQLKVRELWGCGGGGCHVETRPAYDFGLPGEPVLKKDAVMASADSGKEGCYYLTPEETWKKGAMWKKEPINLIKGFRVAADISLGRINELGADGVVFVIQTSGSDRNPNPPGGGLGYKNIPNALGIEIDTWQNPTGVEFDGFKDFFEPACDHMEFRYTGAGGPFNSDWTRLAGPRCLGNWDYEKSITGEPDVEDGGFYPVQISYDYGTARLCARVEDKVIPNHPIMQMCKTVDLEDLLGTNEVTIGFTASTGGKKNRHTVCPWPADECAKLIDPIK